MSSHSTSRIQRDGSQVAFVDEAIPIASPQGSKIDPAANLHADRLKNSVIIEHDIITFNFPGSFSSANLVPNNFGDRFVERHRNSTEVQSNSTKI